MGKVTTVTLNWNKKKDRMKKKQDPQTTRRKIESEKAKRPLKYAGLNTANYEFCLKSSGVCAWNNRICSKRHSTQSPLINVLLFIKWECEMSRATFSIRNTSA